MIEYQPRYAAAFEHLGKLGDIEGPVSEPPGLLHEINKKCFQKCGVDSETGEHRPPSQVDLKAADPKINLRKARTQNKIVAAADFNYQM